MPARHTLKPPALTPHPWSELFGALRGAAPDEPFAKATPADLPNWLDEPPPGSSLDKLLSRLARLRTALSFDDEPGPRDSHFQSLHARAAFELR